MHQNDIRLGQRYVALGTSMCETIVKVLQHPSGRYRSFEVLNERTGGQTRMSPDRFRRPAKLNEKVANLRNTAGGGGTPAGASRKDKKPGKEVAPDVYIVTALALRQYSFSELRMKLSWLSAATLSEELYALKTKGQIALDKSTDPGVPRWYLPHVPYSRSGFVPRNPKEDQAIACGR